MADETIELTEVQEILDGLSSPTDEQLMQAVRGYSERAIGSAAAKLALAGGEGGGSLPDWWTVDSDPGQELLILAGSLEAGNGFFVDLTIAVGGQLSTPNFSANWFATSDGSGDGVIEFSAAEIGFFGADVVTQPEIPASPNAQDIADVLVALGLATQAA